MWHPWASHNGRGIAVGRQDAEISAIENLRF